LAAVVEVAVEILRHLLLLCPVAAVVVARLGRNASTRLLILGRLNLILSGPVERLERRALALLAALAGRAVRHPSAGTS
jgi:hypothetical protein